MTKPVLFRVTNNLNIGGVQRRLRSLLPRLLPYYDVHVVTYKDKGIFFDELASLGVKSHFIPLKGKWDPVGIYKMSRLFKKYNAQIVHTHSLGGNISGILAAAMAKVPVRVAQVHLCHLHWYAQKKLHKKKQIFEEKIIHKLFTHKIIFVSQQSLNYFQKNTKLPKNKLIIIHNGFELPTATDVKIHLKKKYLDHVDQKIIGFIGRIARGKGVNFFIHFAQEILKQDKDRYKFLIIGGGNLAPWQQYVNDHKLTKHILFLGEKKNISDYYRILDCLLFTSEPFAEGMPGVVLEACAVGLPILARLSEPIKEIKEYYSRIKFIDEQKTPAENLNAVLSLPPCSLENLKKEFSIENMLNKTLNLYNSLVQ
jgi:glycosyltransferase involved in cell wall biosynthesis